MVLDSFSTDATPSICQEAGVRFIQHEFDGYVSQKNRALSLARNDWVLSLDGDEALNEEARQSVGDVLQNPDADGFVFNRRNHYCGRWMQYTSLFPDRKLRLFNKNKAEWMGYDPHDRVQLHPGGSQKRLPGELLHWVIQDRADHLHKVEIFSSLNAEAYYQAGKKALAGSASLHATWRFIKEYFINLGVLEGKLGFQFSSLSARYVFLKYSKLRKLHAERSS